MKTEFFRKNQALFVCNNSKFCCLLQKAVYSVQVSAGFLFRIAEFFAKLCFVGKTTPMIQNIGDNNFGKFMNLEIFNGCVFFQAQPKGTGNNYGSGGWLEEGLAGVFVDWMLCTA